jgi:inhibitor of cysteine peptidase
MDVLSLARASALAGAWFMCSPAAGSCAYAEEAPKTMLSLVARDSGRTIDIGSGETVQITLPENATTGYRWAIDHYDEEFIKALASEPHYPAKAVGSGGEVAFLFQGTKTGTGEIVLKQWRQWLGDSSVVARFRVRLNVQP